MMPISVVDGVCRRAGPFAGSPKVSLKATDVPRIVFSTATLEESRWLS